VKPARALKKRRRDRHLAVGRRGKPKERTKGDGGSRKKLVATCRRMTRRAILARRKGHGRQGQGQDNVVRGTQKGRTFRKRHRAKPKRINGITNRGARRQLRLRKVGTTDNDIEDEAGDRSHVWEIWRHCMMPAYKLTSWRSQSK
jgi:hypothetical protein